MSRAVYVASPLGFTPAGAAWSGEVQVEHFLTRTGGHVQTTLDAAVAELAARVP